MTGNEIYYIEKNLHQNIHYDELAQLLTKRIFHLSDIATQNYQDIRKKTVSFKLEHTDRSTGEKIQIDACELRFCTNAYTVPSWEETVIPVDDETWRLALALAEIKKYSESFDKILKTMHRNDIKKLFPSLKPYLPDSKNWDEFDVYRDLYTRIVAFLGPEAQG